MKVTREAAAAIGLSIIVIVIGGLMFATADQPFTDDGTTAQRWVEALCAEDYDTLYALSAPSITLERADFEQHVHDYLRSGEVPFPCAGQVDFNLVRDIAVPRFLVDTVDRAVYFSQVRLENTDQFALIPLWAYHQRGGEWTIWSSVYGAAREGALPLGEAAHVLDGNGLSIGSIQIIAPPEIYVTEGAALIALTARLTTFSRVWEHYEAQLYVGQVAARRVERPEELLEEWRGDFLPPVGGYLAQNFQQTGRLWFSAAEVEAPVTLTFTATAPYTGTIQSAFLDVPLTETAPLEPFNPFGEVDFVGIERDNPIFAVALDAADLPSNQMRIECGRFVLILANDEWKRGTDCTFTEGGEQTLLRGERLTARVTFAGYTLTDPEQFRALTYRRRDEAFVIPYTLWQAE